MKLHRVEVSVVLYVEAPTEDAAIEDTRHQSFNWNYELLNAEITATEVTDVAQIDKDWRGALPYTQHIKSPELTCEQICKASK